MIDFWRLLFTALIMCIMYVIWSTNDSTFAFHELLVHPTLTDEKKHTEMTNYQFSILGNIF